MPFAATPAITLEDALKQAVSQRSDLQAAEAQLRAAERSRSAARAERLPALSLSADYGAIGMNPSDAHGTFSVVGSLKFPIWQGGRIEGDIEQASAALAQRQAELEDLRGQVEADVRKVYLDLEAARSQVQVATENLQVTKENLKLTRQRYDAGVTDNVEVVQSQESVAGAELDYINSVFSHNVAKLSLARPVGQAGDNFAQFLQTRQLAYWTFLAFLVHRKCEDEHMNPKNTELDKKDDSEQPLENLPLDWADEDIEIEDRKPDLGEIEEDTSEI